MTPELLVLALEYYRKPANHPRLSDVGRPLPDSINALAGAFGGAISGEQKAATATALGTSADELEAAVRFFLRQVLMAPGADHYRMLGLSRDASAEQIRKHYRTLIRLFHPDRAGEDVEWAAPYAPRINEAYRVLRNEETRREYDAKLAKEVKTREARSGGVRATPRPPAPTEHSGSRMAAVPVSKRNIRIASLAGILLLAITVLLVSRNQTTPILQADPDRVQQPTPGPAYLQGFPSTTDSVALMEPREMREPAQPASNTPDSTKPPPGDEGTTAPINTAATEPAARMEPREMRESTGSGSEPPDSAGLYPRDEAPTTPPTVAATEPVARTEPRELREPTQLAPDTPDSAKRHPDYKDATTPINIAAAEPVARMEPREKREPTQAASDTPYSAWPHPGDEGATTPINIAATEPVARMKQREMREPTTEPAPKVPDINPGKVVGQLVAAYEAGDLEGLVALFTPDAEVNDGRGNAFIRRDYAGFFATTSRRRLRFSGITWRTSGDTVRGQGAVAVSIKNNLLAPWREQLGAIRFELIRGKDGLRIAKMLHQF